MIYIVAFKWPFLKNRLLTFSNITRETGNDFKDYNYILHQDVREISLALGLKTICAIFLK